MKLNLKQVRILRIALSAGLIIAAAFLTWTDEMIFLYAALAFGIAFLMVHIVFWRCPHCGAFLGRDAGKYCRNCGAELRDLND
ncbi:MAG: hypothetical protein ACOX7K_07220 [Oscillospiraceae bacterium]|jgi:hypothetical protein